MKTSFLIHGCEMPAQQRMAYRVSTLGHWLKCLTSLRQDKQALKATMDDDVASVLKSKNILLWKTMLSTVGYPDLKAVAEFQQRSELVGNVERTGLWPAISTCSDERFRTTQSGCDGEEQFAPAVFWYCGPC